MKLRKYQVTWKGTIETNMTIKEMKSDPFYIISSLEHPKLSIERVSCTQTDRGKKP